MPVTYWIAALLVLFSFSAYGQRQVPNTGAKATTHIISEGAPATDGCSAGDKGEAGHFAALYPWYVQAIQSKVREKWLNEVDPHAPSASRVCLTFDVNRVGEPSNVRIMKSSGLPSLDESALRAVSRVSSFDPLPSDWERDKVSVLFWFDYKPKARECSADDYLKSSGSKDENGLRVWPEEGAKVSLGSNQMFRVIGNSLVTIPSWSVEGEQCKANDCGSISAIGLYSAPRTMPPNPEIALKVQEKNQPCRTGTTRLTLIPEAGR